MSSGARKPRRAAGRVSCSIAPLFPSWIYVSNSGPGHLNSRLERLAHRLMREPENSVVRSNNGGWHYRYDLFELDSQVVREFRAEMERHVRAFLTHFRRPGKAKPEVDKPGDGS